MEKLAPSMPEISRISSGLMLNGFRSLSAWARKRDVNYNTAWAALHGRRSGRKAIRALKLIRRDANV